MGWKLFRLAKANAEAKDRAERLADEIGAIQARYAARVRNADERYENLLAAAGERGTALDEASTDGLVEALNSTLTREDE